MRVKDKHIELGYAESGSVLGVGYPTSGATTFAVVNTDIGQHLQVGMTAADQTPGDNSFLPSGTRVSSWTYNGITDPEILIITLDTAFVGGNGTSDVQIIQFGPSDDFSADGGGITLKGTTDKSILWQNDIDSWEYNQAIRMKDGLGISFRDPQIYIASPGDGYLAIGADVEVELNSAKIELDASGELEIDTPLISHSQATSINIPINAAALNFTTSTPMTF